MMKKRRSLMQRRWAKFRTNRRGFYSLVIFTILFVLSLGAETISNDKPYLVRYNDTYYFPIVKSYQETTFDGDFETEADYKDPYIYTADRLTNSIITIDPESGSIIESFKSPAFSIDGFCFDGSNFWILERSETKLYVTDITGVLVNTFRTPTDTPSGLATGENVIWMGDQAGKIIKLRFN